MNAKQTIPALAKLAPVLAAAGPPALIGVAIGGALLWLLFGGNKNEKSTAPAIPSHDTAPSAPATVSAEKPLATTPCARQRRITREDVATALEYGGRIIPRGEAVAALQALGFHKTAAYKALSRKGRFAEFLEIGPDGWVEWRG